MHSLQSPMRRLLSLAVLLVSLPIAFASVAQTPAPEEGIQYLRLKNPQPVETGKKIEVLEFFSYGCPHCGDLEPILQGWLKNAPADVQFRRVPVVFQDRWLPLAKIYYTLDALGDETKLSPAVFTAIHSGNVQLWQDKTFFDWAAKQGLDRKKVEDMYNSFAINGKVNRSKQLAQTYQVQSVPLIVVDGKFVSNRVSSHAAIPALIDALIVKARAERPKA